jgi:hypothetical protein
MPPRPLRLATIAALLVGACSGSTQDSDNSPGDLAITPSSGYTSDPVATVITGTGFLAKVTQPQGGGEPTSDTRHRAWLGTKDGMKELDVTWRTTTTLDANVPGGLEPGIYDLTVENALGNRGTREAAYTVLLTPTFSATASVGHPSVRVGQTLTLTVTIANGGKAEVADFKLGSPVFGWDDGTSAGPATAPTDIPSKIGAGEKRSFSFTYAPDHAGNISITASAMGVDSVTGSEMTAALAAPVAVVVLLPAVLTAKLSASTARPTVGQGVKLTLELANAAGAAAADVTAVTPSTTPAGNMVCPATAPASSGASPSAAAPIRIAGGATETFTWTCTPTVQGNYTLGAVVAARDEIAGTAMATSVTGLTGSSSSTTQFSVCGKSASGATDCGSSRTWGEIIWGNRTAQIDGGVADAGAGSTTARFVAYAGKTLVESTTRTADDSGTPNPALFKFTIGNPNLVGGINRIQITACKGTRCGTPENYSRP